MPAKLIKDEAELDIRKNSPVKFLSSEAVILDIGTAFLRADGDELDLLAEFLLGGFF